MASDEEIESRKIVRMYSWEVEKRIPPGSDARILGEVLNKEAGPYDPQGLAGPWRKFFEPAESTGQEIGDPMTELLAVESVKLREKWVTFHRNSPEEERLDLQRSEPTMEGVVDTVTKITNAWQARRGKGWPAKVGSLFLRFGRTLNSHSSLLKVLPEGSEYVSIFAGSLNAVIKACENHEKIVEGLSEGLCAISEHVVECKVDQALFQTPEMTELIVDLYAHIFVFLGSTMDWVMEKRYRRMLDAFNESFSKRFDNEVGAIKHKAERIRNLAAQSSRAEVRVTRIALEDLHRDVRVGLVAGERQQAELQYRMQKLEEEMAEMSRVREYVGQAWQQLANLAKLMLQDNAMGWLSANREVTHGIPATLVADTSFRDVQISQVMRDWRAEDIAVNSRGLEDFFSRGRVRLSSDRFRPVMVSPEALFRLSSWSSASTSSPSGVLWLEGPPIEADDFENPLTSVAAKFIDLADRSGVPVISYFCQLSRHERLRRGNKTREVQVLVATLYALLRQMVELLLPQFEADVDLSKSRFQCLDGTVDSWDDALAVFRDLLGLMVDGGVLCVLDGLHWLDDRSTDTYLEKLIDALRGDRLRVLFTTTGRSACLRRTISTANTFVESLQSKGKTESLDRSKIWG